MLAALLALALAAQPSPDDDTPMQRVGSWAVGASDFGCLALPDSAPELTLSRSFDAPAREALDLTGPLAEGHAGATSVPVSVRFFADDGRELGALTLNMRLSEDDGALWLDDAPGDLFARLRGAARAEFSDGRATLAVDLDGAGTALDALDRCVAERPAP
jgi:hypothetical protein